MAQKPDDNENQRRGRKKASSRAGDVSFRDGLFPESESVSGRSSTRGGYDRFCELLGNMTSEGDDRPDSVRTGTGQDRNLTEPDSPPPNTNTAFYLSETNTSRTSKRSKKTTKRIRKQNAAYDRELSATEPIGSRRIQQLSDCMEQYKNYIESAEQMYLNYGKDDAHSQAQRRKYHTAIWYELKNFFRGIHPLDEIGLQKEQRLIEEERDQYFKQFLELFNSFNKHLFSTVTHIDARETKRRHLSELHINHCSTIFKALKKLFRVWDRFAGLFPSQAALEKYDRHLDSQSKEGRMLYEKLSVFQAWYNLNFEINGLFSTLGRIMGCNNCTSWPHLSSSRDVSRPGTPLPSSDSDSYDGIHFSPSKSFMSSNSLSVLQAQASVNSAGSPMSVSSDFHSRRLCSNISTQTYDSQNPLSASAPLTDYYSRYINDQLIHGRVELMASIFRSKHGPLVQKLRFIFRKEQTTLISLSSGSTKTAFDHFLKSYALSSVLSVPADYLKDASSCELMNEYLLLNKKFQEQRNPNSGTNKKKPSNSSSPGQVNNILGRFDQNPTLKTSIFGAASAPTLILRMRMNDRSVFKRQAYFLDYLDPTLYPHMPGSSLFPDPCTFLDNLPFNGPHQSNSEDLTIIGRMLHISFRLYEKHSWEEAAKLSDMFELFHLPSLYPQYVFLVQIPLDLMLAWQKYHQDRKMDHPSTKSALLLLIDECKVLIHSATLIRHYVKQMTVDVFESAEMQLIQDEFARFDLYTAEVLHEIINYIESFTQICLRTNSFHDCITMIKEQWRTLKRYATLMNIEETLGEKFLNMCSSVIQHFHTYINVFNGFTNTTEPIKTESIKKKFRRKYQKILTTDILRETKAIYDDCALTVNFYLQKPVCRRFLLILKTARFERIKFEERQPVAGEKKHLTCLLFAPAEYFEENATKIQLIRTLSSSFRLNSSDMSFNDTNDDQIGQTSASVSSVSYSVNDEKNAPLVYILCVPVSPELENEWRGATHTVSAENISALISPLSNQWKTTTLFIMTHQISHLRDFEQSFRDRLAKTNVQQNDFYDFPLKPEQILQKRSCFEKVDHAMNTLAHAIIGLSVCVIENIEKFEQMIEKIDTAPESRSDNVNDDPVRSDGYLHTEDRAFIYAMDLIRDTNYYATQIDQSVLRSQAARQIQLARVWLNFIQKKKTIGSSWRIQKSIPMWLIPGIRFLRDIGALHFTNLVDDKVFCDFHKHIEDTFAKLYNPREASDRLISHRSRAGSTFKQYRTKQEHKQKRPLSRIEAIDRLDREIDQRRINNCLIGKIKKSDQNPQKLPTLSKRMEQDLAFKKIRKYHRLNLLASGKYAITYKCTINGNEVLCYKQYKIQHNDAQAINNVLNQLVPLMHIDHENLIKYRGIALEYDHILFFMEYCSHGTVAQVLLGTSPSHAEANRLSSSIVCSIVDTTDVDKGIIQTTSGYAFFAEYLVRIYLKQLLSALSCLHKNEIIHRDVRNVNIFFTDSTKQSIKLGDVNFVYDFKFMKKQSSLLDMETIVNMRESIVFYAPETITQNETTTKSDVWSLGCALVHMLTGRIPWSNPSIASSAYYLKVVNWVANGAQPIISTDLSLSKKCLDFLENCFRHDPQIRPSIDELLEHPFVKD